MFRSLTNHLTAIDLPSPAGEDVVDEYGIIINEEGQEELGVIGKRNIYIAIQEAAAGTSVYEVIERYALTGDLEPLHKQKGIYADVTGSPRTLAELEQFRIDSRNAFYSLPADVRHMFGDNYHIFMSDPDKAQSVLDSLDPARVRAAQKAQERASQQASGEAATQSTEASGSRPKGVTVGAGGVE